MHIGTSLIQKMRVKSWSFVLLNPLKKLVLLVLAAAADLLDCPCASQKNTPQKKKSIKTFSETSLKQNIFDVFFLQQSQGLLTT